MSEIEICQAETPVLVRIFLDRGKFSSSALHAFVRANIALGTTLITDAHQSYLGLTGYRASTRSSPFGERGA